MLFVLFSYVNASSDDVALYLQNIELWKELDSTIAEATPLTAINNCTKVNHEVLWLFDMFYLLCIYVVIGLLHVISIDTVLCICVTSFCF